MFGVLFDFTLLPFDMVNRIEVLTVVGKRRGERKRKVRQGEGSKVAATTTVSNWVDSVEVIA